MGEENAQWLTTDEAELWRTMITVADRFRSAFDEDLRASTGLSWEDFGLLVHLSESPPDGIRLSELADSLLFTSSRVNRTLDSLVENGWAWREPRSDGRWAGLTDDGHERLATAAPSHLASVRRRVFDRIDTDLAPVLGAFQALAVGLAADPN